MRCGFVARRMSHYHDSGLVDVPPAIREEPSAPACSPINEQAADENPPFSLMRLSE